MDRAGETGAAAAVVVDDAVPAMGTDIVEGPDATVFLAHHQDLLFQDTEDRIIAALGNVGFHYGNQPGPCPQPVPLPAHEITVVEAGRIELFRTVVDPGLLGFQ